jgi:hypothetical protein
MSTPPEAINKSPSRISEWTGMKAMITSLVGIGLLPLVQLIKPEAAPVLALAALGAYAVGLIGLWKPLNSIHHDNIPSKQQD